MMLYLTDETMAAIGDKLGQTLAQGELESLQDLLRHAAEACTYAADDLGERAEFDRKHGGVEEEEFAEEAESYSTTEGLLGQLAEQIKLGEQRYRDDSDDDDEGCQGHPAGPNDPMGETVYCDGSCRTGGS